jgi:hypothetical protein
VASVFLSYDREDLGRGKTIASALEKAGHSVWWDRYIRGGSQFSREIEEALKRADAVAVLWSSHSVESGWVRDEAAVGRHSGRLVPVLIEPRCEITNLKRNGATYSLKRNCTSLRVGGSSHDEVQVMIKSRTSFVFYPWEALGLPSRTFRYCGPKVQF